MTTEVLADTYQKHQDFFDIFIFMMFIYYLFMQTAVL